MTNAIVWRLEDEPVSGRLEVRCGYVLNSRGLMDVSLGEHLVLPDEGMPRDPTDLVRLLQRAMPYEMFDPNEHALETTVSTPEFKRGSSMQQDQKRFNYDARKSKSEFHDRVFRND